ncbi:MAG TPA: hypothetical protein VJU59_27145 [Paraburkholderia sp.]|nr:hypothetical protein [Paraburkholderia sp.]
MIGAKQYARWPGHRSMLNATSQFFKILPLGKDLNACIARLLYAEARATGRQRPSAITARGGARNVS